MGGRGAGCDLVFLIEPPPPPPPPCCNPSNHLTCQSYLDDLHSSVRRTKAGSRQGGGEEP